MYARLIPLKQLANARSGDKGSNSNIGILAHSADSYTHLFTHLTAEKVKRYFQPMGVASVIRYELPNLQAFNFVLNGILGEGGSCSLRIDPQGKALGQILLEMLIEAPTSHRLLHTNMVSIDYPQNGIAVLTMQRPAKRNALNIELLTEFCQGLIYLKSQNLRALIIQGQGSAFCAGMDLNVAVDPLHQENSAELLAELFTLLIEAPFVTLAAAHGMAAGGGAGILSACDLVIAADDLKIVYPEIRRGLIPALVAPLLMRLLPRRLVHELMYLGEPINADRALIMGLINKIVPAEALFAHALEIAKSVLKNAPGALLQTKELLRKLDRKTYAEDLSLCLPYHQAARLSAEAQEGVLAFQQKRPASWECE